MFKFLFPLSLALCTSAAENNYTRPVEELVRAAGYPLETHNLTTEDGYILTLHRIPRGKANKATEGKVVLLVHALLCSSSFWLLYPGRSLGYALADAGYDVWLINTRGNSYSRRHTHLDPDKDKAFWDFSWHEVGVYDLPATIDYIISETGVPSLFYCGHSQGNTVLYVLASLRPEYNSKVRVQVSLGPTAFLGEAKSPIVRLAALLGFTGFYSRLLLLDTGLGEFLSRKSWVSVLGKTFCHGDVAVVCELVIFLLVGFNKLEISPSSIPVIIGQAPAGASTKQETHYVQLARSGRFRQYDYGASRNQEIYGMANPPDYNLSRITVPGYSVHGSHDWLTTLPDVEKLHSLLGNPKERYYITDPPFNHLDYMCGKNITDIIVPKILEYFGEY